MIYSALILRADLEAIREISTNVSDDRITPYIREAHELDLRSFLGADLYAEIMTQADGGTLTAANTTLIDDYLKRPLSFYAYSRMMEGHHASVTRYGIVRKENEFSENLNVADQLKLADNARKTAAAYMELARAFLNENGTTYPLWGGDTTNRNTPQGLNIGSIG